MVECNDRHHACEHLGGKAALTRLGRNSWIPSECGGACAQTEAIDSMKSTVQYTHRHIDVYTRYIHEYIGIVDDCGEIWSTPSLFHFSMMHDPLPLKCDKT